MTIQVLLSYKLDNTFKKNTGPLWQQLCISQCERCLPQKYGTFPCTLLVSMSCTDRNPSVVHLALTRGSLRD